jgi:hypothetical protein
MTRRKDRARFTKLSENLNKITLLSQRAQHEDGDTEDLQVLMSQPIEIYPDTSKTLRMKKFRFQLLHQWLVGQFKPCKVADIGGGKGLLAYLLMKSGWDVTVIDPVQQPLPDKYKDILAGSRVKINSAERIPYIAAEFMPEMGKDFAMLLGMHAHGCNVKIIDAAAAYGCGFAIFPCCVIDEPFYPPLGVHWLESLADYAVRKGLVVKTVRLNFKGQNIGLYSSVG